MAEAGIGAKPIKKKINVTTTMSPYLYEWMTTQVKNGKFTSNADAISVAVTELKARMEGSGNPVTASETVKNSALEAIEAIKNAAISNEISTKLLVTWITAHPEFLEEFNDFIRTQKGSAISHGKRVAFE